MPKTTSLARTLCTLTFLCALGTAPAAAQSIISNIPSTDTTPAGTRYVEFNFGSHIESRGEGGSETYGVKTLYGLRRGMEAGLSVSYTDAAGRQPVMLKPNAKWKFYENEEAGTAAAVGGMLFVPTSDRAGAHAFGMLYATASKKLRARFGPRFTGGVYSLAGGGRGAGPRAGALVGYEQPLHRRLTFSADWYSGRNNFGYLTPGFIFSLGRRTGGFAGYAFGNAGRDKDLFLFSYGVRF